MKHYCSTREVKKITNSKWALEEEEKEKLIRTLAQELIPLRMKADISQGDLAGLLGISRQTYGAIERMARPMAWNTYLSLIFFFDNNLKTRQMLHTLGIFPQEIIMRFNDGVGIETAGVGNVLGSEVQAMMGKLDEQAIRSLKTLIMVEYARCSGITAETVVKAFGGSTNLGKETTDREFALAIRRIRQKMNDESGGT